MENQTTKPKKRGFLRGCLTVIIVYFVICAAIGIAMSLTMDKMTTSESVIGEYIALTDEQTQQVDSVLADCGIETLDAAEHDELLDNAHVDGETGYRLTSDGIDNIILYLTSDKTVNQIRYNGYILYADGVKNATLQDYTVSLDELSKYQSLCQKKVKEILKSPSTAKFPNYTEWGFRQEMNAFTVQGYVDVQNSFGAETRSTFQFVIDMDSDTIRSFIFDGEELIN